MSTGSIELPSECIEQTANGVVSRYKGWAAAMFFLDGVFATSGFAMIGHNDRPDRAMLAAGLGFWLALFTVLGLRFLRKAARTRQTGLASHDRSIKWYLDGRVIAAADARGTPRPELSFKITPALRTALVAVPRAQVVPPS